jgi:hypothetical protein
MVLQEQRICAEDASDVGEGNLLRMWALCARPGHLCSFLLISASAIGAFHLYSASEEYASGDPAGAEPRRSVRASCCGTTGSNGTSASHLRRYPEPG